MGSVMNCYYEDQSSEIKKIKCLKSPNNEHVWEKFQWYTPSRYEICKFCKKTCYYK